MVFGIFDLYLNYTRISFNIVNMEKFKKNIDYKSIALPTELQGHAQ